MNTLTLKEAACLLKMEQSTLSKKVRAGIIPGVKPAKNWVFVEDDLIGYLRASYQGNFNKTTKIINQLETQVNSKTNVKASKRYFELLGIANSSKNKSTKT
ncbi:MAG TPA: helix-turn-helix domain-containing protein [Methylotenera sp.]|jgi:excisionase family DNA binding protein|nr:helix-turn-helix domain-containing protein [Methylotenera sp.]